MSHYRYFIIETYENKGEASSKKVRARPVAGQGVPTTLNVECSVAIGACQDSCRLIHARRGALSSADVGVWMGSESRSGLSLTTAM